MNTQKCTYIFKKGKNQGERCFVKTKEGSLLCSSHITTDLKSFPSNLWKMGKLLGRGGGGVVYTCKSAKTQENFAIKIFPLDNKYYLPELEILKKYQSKFIPKLITYGTCIHFNYLIIEKLYPVEELIPYSKQILECIEFFYKNGLTHGDIKKDNIMKTSTGNIVLIDFGTTCELYTVYIKLSEIFGTLSYMSLNGMLGFNLPKNDLESFIYVLLEEKNVYGRLPWFSDKDPTKIIEHKQLLLNNILTKDKKTLKEFNLNNNDKFIEFIIDVLSLGIIKPGHEKKPNYRFYKKLAKNF